MKKYENDNMNYDENGYYSNDSENSGMDYNNKHGFEPNEGFIKIVNGFSKKTKYSFFSFFFFFTSSKVLYP